MSAAMPKRVSLPFYAPVYVTVNLETGDIERVYMDDEAVEFDTDADVVSLDDGKETYVQDPAVVVKAAEIADTADWTTTEGRCAVWRGAWGGPADIIEIFRAGLEHLAATDAAFVTSHGHKIEPGDVAAALRFLDDSHTWDTEHQLLGEAS